MVPGAQCCITGYFLPFLVAYLFLLPFAAPEIEDLVLGSLRLSPHVTRMSSSQGLSSDLFLTAPMLQDVNLDLGSHA
jgi:hypothetical protein